MQRMALKHSYFSGSLNIEVLYVCGNNLRMVQIITKSL